MRMWDLHSGQALRVMTQAKGPITCLIAVPRAWLSVDSHAPHATSGRVRTALPLASFSKYHTAAEAGAVKSTAAGVRSTLSVLHRVD